MGFQPSMEHNRSLCFWGLPPLWGVSSQPVQGRRDIACQCCFSEGLLNLPDFVLAVVAHGRSITAPQ